MAAKSAIRDTARVLGLKASESMRLTKLIPSRPGITISQAMAESPELTSLVKSDARLQKIINIASKIEGLPRQTGIHACGVCLGQKPITEYCPTAIVTDEVTGEKVVTSQFVGPECEEVGLVKMDFLGLRTLDVIESGIEQIVQDDQSRQVLSNTLLHMDRPLKQEDIPITDIETYRFLAEGNTDGVFQFESAGMTSLVKKMFKDAKATDTPEKGAEYFERLIAAVALYRPGPMDEIPHYLEAMDSGNIQYDHPLLESILKSTYGILVYQEEIMFAVRKLAGFSAGQSDTIRKAMGGASYPFSIEILE